MADIVDVTAARRYGFRGAVTSIIRPLTLHEFGVDTASFVRVAAPTLHSSPFDPYDCALEAESLVRHAYPGYYRQRAQEWLRLWDSLHEAPGDASVRCSEFWDGPEVSGLDRALLQGLQPTRRRNCFRFLAFPHGTTQWRLVESGVPVFIQDVSDTRARARRFAATPAELRAQPLLRWFVCLMCQLVSQASERTPRPLVVTLHLMLTYAGADGGEPAPEGHHQDGADYIVSAVILERHNVNGGETAVSLSKDGEPVYRRVLKVGEGMFHSDLTHDLWHGVSRITRADGSRPGWRSILGLDFQYV